jgi:hypothetical protein
MAATTLRVRELNVDLLTTVADDADDHFLPTILTPDLAAVALT